MKASILKKLICPVCVARGRMGRGPALAKAGKAGQPALACRQCGTRFPFIGGIVNLAGEITRPVIFSTQWAMEFEPLVAAYENLWRPSLTHCISNLQWEMKMSHQLMNVASGMDVLDLACGTGNFTRLFSAAAQPGDVIGIDLSLPMLQRGQRILREDKKTGITLMRADVTRWSFASGVFDRIHCAGALHLFPDLEDVLKAVYRSLRPGGCFVGATYCLGGDFFTQMVQKIAADASWIRWFEPQELQSLTRKAGFTGWEERTFRQGIVFQVQKPASQGAEV